MNFRRRLPSSAFMKTAVNYVPLRMTSALTWRRSTTPLSTLVSFVPLVGRTSWPPLSQITNELIRGRRDKSVRTVTSFSTKRSKWTFTWRRVTRKYLEGLRRDTLVTSVGTHSTRVEASTIIVTRSIRDAVGNQGYAVRGNQGTRVNQATQSRGRGSQGRGRNRSRKLVPVWHQIQVTAQTQMHIGCGCYQIRRIDGHQGKVRTMVRTVCNSSCNNIILHTSRSQFTDILRTTPDLGTTILDSRSP